MDRFVKIDPSIRTKKILITDRDDALIEYYPNFMSSLDTNELFKELKNLTDWKIGETMTKGGMKMTSRLVMGLTNPNLKEQLIDYSPENIKERHSVSIYKSDDPELKIIKTQAIENHNEFSDLLMEAHERVKDLTGETFNYAFLNYYRDGNDHIGFHSDKEEVLEESSTIASLSLGATRDFVIRHIADTRSAQNMIDDKDRIEALEAAKQTIPLKNGSLLLMKKQTQKIYQHHVPKRLKVKSPRINITFRNIKDLNNVM